MSLKKKKELSPRSANTLNEICLLNSDNAQGTNGWISISEGHVVLYNQKNGQSSTGNVRFTKSQFNKFMVLSASQVNSTIPTE